MPKTTNQRCKRTIASRESKKQKRNANTGSLRCQARELTQRWANSEGKLTILLTGKCGVGKSHLANALLGDDKYAEEGRQRNRATTTSLTCHSEKVGNVTVEIFDTPGLQDRHLERETILQEIKEKITNGVHLCVFCLRMDVKILSADVEVMRDISNALNNNWSNAIVALTFANRVACDNLFGNSKSSRRRFFREEMMDCEKVIREDLKNLGVDSSNASKIPIIPVGTYRDPQLPNTEDWLSKFWMKAYKTTKIESRVYLARINVTRLHGQQNGNIPPLQFSSSQESNFIRCTVKSYMNYIRENKDLILSGAVLGGAGMAGAAGMGYLLTNFVDKNNYAAFLSFCVPLIRDLFLKKA